MKENSSQERISQKLAPVQKENKGKSKIVLAIVLIVLLLAVIFTLIWVFLKPQDADTRNVVITPDNVDEVLTEMKGKDNEAGTYEVKMNTSWEFENGHTASSNAYVENSTANANDVYFDVVRSDTGETILKSPTIPVGSHLENITLDTELSAGSYDCVMTYHLLDESGEPESTLNLKLKIIINN